MISDTTVAEPTDLEFSVGTTPEDSAMENSARVRLKPVANARRLTNIEVDGLFDLHDHRVPLHMQDRITILHGPNGVGKTILLRMTAAFFSGDYLEYADIPFREFRLAFLDGSTVTLTKRIDNDNLPLLDISLREPTGEK